MKFLANSIFLSNLHVARFVGQFPFLILLHLLAKFDTIYCFLPALWSTNLLYFSSYLTSCSFRFLSWFPPDLLNLLMDKWPRFSPWISSLFHLHLLLSVQFSHSVVSDSLQPHESQHARPPCPSQTPGIHSNSCPLSQWCHPAISSSVVPFYSCPQSLPASGNCVGSASKIMSQIWWFLTTSAKNNPGLSQHHFLSGFL